MPGLNRFVGTWRNIAVAVAAEMTRKHGNVIDLTQTAAV